MHDIVETRDWSRDQVFYIHGQLCLMKKSRQRQNQCPFWEAIEVSTMRAWCRSIDYLCFGYSGLPCVSILGRVCVCVWLKPTRFGCWKRRHSSCRPVSRSNPERHAPSSDSDVSSSLFLAPSPDAFPPIDREREKKLERERAAATTSILSRFEKREK